MSKKQKGNINKAKSSPAIKIVSSDPLAQQDIAVEIAESFIEEIDLDSTSNKPFIQLRETLEKSNLENRFVSKIYERIKEHFMSKNEAAFDNGDRTFITLINKLETEGLHYFRTNFEKALANQSLEEKLTTLKSKQSEFSRKYDEYLFNSLKSLENETNENKIAFEKSKTIEDVSSPTQPQSVNKNHSYRRRVLLLLLLTFKKLELPQEFTNEKAVRVFSDILGTNNPKKIREILASPSKNSLSTASVKRHIEDLNFVKNSLIELDQDKSSIDLIEREIGSFKTDLL